MAMEDMEKWDMINRELIEWDSLYRNVSDWILFFFLELICIEKLDMK